MQETMNYALLCSLFVLFSGEQDVDYHAALLEAAMYEVRAQLREDADETQARLCYLCAAIANLRYTELYGARDRALVTYAGTVARQPDGEQQLRFARNLVSSYRALCSDLLCDAGSFVFTGVRG